MRDRRALPAAFLAYWNERMIVGLVVVLVALAGAITLAPRFLDRIYYAGSVSDHFDGERFFNPNDPRETGPRRRFSLWRFARFAFGMDRAPWPRNVPVRPDVPPARVDGEAMRASWVGHATVLVQTRGLNILTDPVWSERASPFAFMGPRRVAAPGIAFADLPPIDLVLLSHNHYDHTDIATLKRLWERDRPAIVTPLGNDAILARAGIGAIARDWGDRVEIAPGIAVLLDRVHHWSSRWGADRNRALWAGFTVTLPGGNLFFAGDTGWGDGSWVKAVAERGPIRLALIPIGAYLPRELMQGSHIGPDEAAAIFTALGARQALAVHWGTFQLSSEGHDDPPRRLAAAGLPPGRFRAPAPGEAWDVPVD